jgi:hypothetical protein
MPFRDASSRSEYHRSWYAKNGIAKRKAVEDRKASLQRWLNDYKAALSCQRCGFSHPACIDFHHLDPKSKRATIALMPRQGFSLESIKAEIAKRVVLCANCHRILHWEQAREAEGQIQSP